MHAGILRKMKEGKTVHEWCMQHPWMTFIIVLHAINCIAALFGKDVSLIRFYNGKPEEPEKEGKTDDEAVSSDG